MHRAFEVDRNIPENIALDELCDGLASAHYEYIRQIKKLGLYNDIHKSLVILMIIQPGEANFADQRLLHLQLVKKYKNSIKLKRVTLAEVYAQGRINESTGELYFNGNPVSLVYFRAGYTPDDYPTDKEWDARLLIERSFSIKCPNIGYHLAGTKKVQEVISTREVLSNFVDSPEDLSALMECFAGLYNLDVINQSESVIKEVENTKKKVLQSPSSFVMKPQREGGGNNIYGNDIIDAFAKMSDQEIAAYIIMERILPPSQNSILIRNGTIFEASCHCELGVYGIFLGDGSNESYESNTVRDFESTSPIHVNRFGGYLLRVKPNTSNEGGVQAGYAVLSSLDLI
jgi:glutathione synthase